MCRYWSCGWLYQPAADGLRRPDISGYAVDPVPQEIVVDERPVFALQIWLDPKRPDAHRDPALRDYLAAMWNENHLVAIVRWQNDTGQNALFLAPPACSDDGQWIEKLSPLVSSEQLEKRLAEVKR